MPKESENAKAVAQEVIQTVRKGQKVIKGEIIRKHGYSQSVSERPSKVTDTQSYKDEIEPFLEGLIKERERILKALKTKDLSKVQYEGLVRSLDLATKNIQLLSGGATERVAGIEITFKK
ncbi:hypothetical protein [Methanoculleus sp.]|jgi:hypothetical protein|uniref:hypothetical protein n=1 Tax=Methanoculleus sp. TaxID=90427 RepID=UPI0025E723CF|nr:hypothetical protein [Methanoculleus sp.]MCK9319536.1 hypothetical protein [Methanoculleus sp.]